MGLYSFGQNVGQAATCPSDLADKISRGRSVGARRKIILHIGAGKTGSSAIQRFLDLNVDALRRENIVVPDNDLALTGRACGNQSVD